MLGVLWGRTPPQGSSMWERLWAPPDRLLTQRQKEAAAAGELWGGAEGVGSHYKGHAAGPAPSDIKLRTQSRSSGDLPSRVQGGHHGLCSGPTSVQGCCVDLPQPLNSPWAYAPIPKSQGLSTCPVTLAAGTFYTLSLCRHCRQVSSQAAVSAYVCTG